MPSKSLVCLEFHKLGIASIFMNKDLRALANKGCFLLIQKISKYIEPITSTIDPIIYQRCMSFFFLLTILCTVCIYKVTL